MRSAGYIFIGIMFGFALAGYGQEGSAPKTEVLFDPLFWKKDLKLSPLQCQKIREINSAYFMKLTAALHQDINNRSAMRVKAVQFLSDRSEKIWETFQPRQRKKWQKLWDDSGKYEARRKNW